MRNLKFSYLLLLLCSCQTQKTKVPFQITELPQGFNSYEAYKLEKQDSVAYLPHVPPPFPDMITNSNLIEAEDGRVYFYYFARRQHLCGYMLEDGETSFAVYEQDLDTLSPQSLLLVDSNSIPSLMRKITKTNEQVAVSIGIQREKSTNKVLLLFVNRLYQNPPRNSWKVRRLVPKEETLLNRVVLTLPNEIRKEF